MENAYCTNCRFWAQHTPLVNGDAKGSCRRYAPSPRLVNGHGWDFEVAWPLVMASDFCGEFQPQVED